MLKIKHNILLQNIVNLFALNLTSQQSVTDVKGQIFKFKSTWNQSSHLRLLKPNWLLIIDLCLLKLSSIYSHWIFQLLNLLWLLYPFCILLCPVSSEDTVSCCHCRRRIRILIIDGWLKILVLCRKWKAITGYSRLWKSTKDWGRQ